MLPGQQCAGNRVWATVRTVAYSLTSRDAIWTNRYLIGFIAISNTGLMFFLKTFYNQTVYNSFETIKLRVL